MAITFLACLAITAAADKILIDGVAARVNGNVITIGEVVRMMTPVQQELVVKYRGDVLIARLKEAYADALNSLIETRLIIDAYNKQDMKIPEWVVEERVEEVIKDNFKGDRSELMAVLARERVSYTEWRERWRERIIVASMRSSYVGQKIKIPPKSVKERFERDSEKYRRPGMVKLRMIFIKCEDPALPASAGAREEAGEVLGKLAAGAMFADVAKAYSDGSKAEEGGDWGWVEPRDLRKEIASAISALEVGSVSGVIETVKGFYIVQVEARKDEVVRSFDDVRAEIEEELLSERGEEIYKAWIERLKADSYVEVVEVDLFSAQ